jgi:hypothetical protein
VTIDIKTGKTHEYAYQLDTTGKTTISDILAINDHAMTAMIARATMMGIGEGNSPTSIAISFRAAKGEALVAQCQ